MVIHFHLCLTDGGLDQLTNGSRCGSAAACARSACASCITAAAVAGTAVCRSLLTAAVSALCGTCTSAAVCAARRAASVLSGCAAGSTASGIICTRTARIGTALSALRIRSGHDDDLFLFYRFFCILSRLFAFCGCSFPLCTRCRCRILVVFRFVSFRFKHVRTQLYCASSYT